MAKTTFFSSLIIVTALWDFFPIFFDIENQKNWVKNAGTPSNKVKNPSKFGSREFFFSRFKETDAYAKSRDFFLFLKGVILLRIQFCICWAVWDTWLDSDFIPRKSKKSKNRKSDFKFWICIKNNACMRNLSAWMHV